MSQPFVGEIRMFGGNFAPAGWAFCHGQLLPISENETLFNLIGTTYGGDGQSTFALPDLRGRIPIHQGTGPGGSTRILGEAAGSESLYLTVNQIPAHSHAVQNAATSAAADRRNPKGAKFAKPREPAYAAPGTGSPLDTITSGATGGSQPHENMQPFLCISFIISLYGIFPSQA
jgi:microcystin-dependent protein